MNNLKNDSNADDTMACHAINCHYLVHCLAASEPVCRPAGSTSPGAEKNLRRSCPRSHSTAGSRLVDPVLDGGLNRARTAVAGRPAHLPARHGIATARAIRATAHSESRTEIRVAWISASRRVSSTSENVPFEATQAASFPQVRASATPVPP